MKVIHIFPYSARISGGHSNAIRGFIDCQRSSGIDASGISPLSEETPTEGTNIGEWIQEVPFDSISNVLAKIKELTEEAPCIIHLHTIDPFSTQLAAVARGCNLKITLTSHGQLNCRSIIHGLKKSIYLAAYPSPLRHASSIHVLTYRERKRLRWMLPWFRGHISVIPHVIEAQEEKKIATEKPQVSDTFRILHLGRLDVKNKGLDILLRAFSKAGIKQARLILAGPDWNGGRAALEAEAEAIGCPASVDFPGAVYGEFKEQLIRSADLFVVNSRWEAFSISLVEAMARGIPVLISNRLNLAPELKSCGAAKIVGCDVSAVAAGLRELAEDPVQRKNLSTQGLSWVKTNTSSEAVGSKFLAFYQRIMNA
jgi:glycosyltransferase involved in cell wall biosynthesis